MNRSYSPENRYHMNHTVSPVEETAEKASAFVESILRFFDFLLGFLAEPAVRATVRVFGTVACFFGFVFVIGAVEAGTLTFGAGILASLLLFAIAFFCVYRPKARKH